MGDIIYTPKVRIYRDPARITRAYIAGFPEPVLFGSHGTLRDHFKKLYPGRETETAEYPHTSDYLAAAVGA